VKASKVWNVAIDLLVSDEMRPVSATERRWTFPPWCLRGFRPLTLVSPAATPIGDCTWQRAARSYAIQSYATDAHGNVKRVISLRVLAQLKMRATARRWWSDGITMEKLSSLDRKSFGLRNCWRRRTCVDVELA
jgi:hypothetical protein